MTKPATKKKATRTKAQPAKRGRPRKVIEVAKPKRKYTRRAAVVPVVEQPKRTPGMKQKIGMKLMQEALATMRAERETQRMNTVWRVPDMPPGVTTRANDAELKAHDDALCGYMNDGGFQNQFPGFQYLAQLAQIGEYRKMALTLADEMTRKWIKVIVVGEGDKSKAKRAEELTKAIEKFQLRKHIRKCVENDAFFGRAHLYLDMMVGKSRAYDVPGEVEKPLFASDKKVGKDSLKGFTVVEAYWVYPGLYNSINPLATDFYKPNTWYVMDKIVHDSRLMMICANPVPDMLKAAYSFGGLSLSQIAMPYVNNWLRTRQAVSDIVHCFSTSGILTDMEAALSVPMDNDVNTGDGEAFTDIFTRVKFFNEVKDNKGTMILNKETEEFFQFNTPLSGLDALQAQSQEQMSAISSIPLVKLLGITPSGLNATSDGEIRVFYDYVHSQQEKVLRDPIARALDIIQLSEFGAIDDALSFEFVPLYQLSEKEQADTRKTNADTDSVLIEAGIIAAEEARGALIQSPDSAYSSLELVNHELNDDNDEEEEGEESQGADISGVKRG